MISNGSGHKQGKVVVLMTLMWRVRTKALKLAVLLPLLLPQGMAVCAPWCPALAKTVQQAADCHASAPTDHHCCTGASAQESRPKSTSSLRGSCCIGDCAAGDLVAGVQPSQRLEQAAAAQDDGTPGPSLNRPHQKPLAPHSNSPPDLKKGTSVQDFSPLRI